MTLHKKEQTLYGDLVGTIRLGSFQEKIQVSLGHWSVDDYLTHWKAALAGLVEGEPLGCIVTSLGDPALGGMTFTWCYYKVGEDFAFQNCLHIMDENDPTRPEGSFASWVPPRETVSEDGECISEWAVPWLG